MKNIMKKINLILLASTALFVQVRAEDLQATINNSQAILENVQMLHDTVMEKGSINAHTRRVTNQKIDKELRQLPAAKKTELEPLIETFKKELTKSDAQQSANFLSSFRAVKDKLMLNILNAQADQSQAGYGARAYAGAKSIVSGAASGLGRIASAPGRAARRAVSPITSRVSAYFDATPTQKDKAAAQLENLEPQVATLMLEIAELGKQDPTLYAIYVKGATALTPEVKTKNAEMLAAGKRRLSILNNEISACKVTLGEENSLRKNVALTAGVALDAITAVTLTGAIADIATDGQITAALKDYKGTVNDPMGTANKVYESFDAQNVVSYLQATGVAATISGWAVGATNLYGSAKEYLGQKYDTAKGYASAAKEAAMKHIYPKQYEAAGALGNFLEEMQSQVTPETQNKVAEIFTWMGAFEKKARTLPVEARAELNSYINHLADNLGFQTEVISNLAEMNRMEVEFLPAIENKLNSLLQEQAVGHFGKAFGGLQAGHEEAAGAIGKAFGEVHTVEQSIRLNRRALGGVADELVEQINTTMIKNELPDEIVDKIRSQAMDSYQAMRSGEISLKTYAEIVRNINEKLNTTVDLLLDKGLSASEVIQRLWQ